MEQWKTIEGYENYSVSSEGRVRNDRTENLLKPSKKGRGYQGVILYPGKKRVLVHRLVALTFLPNPNDLPQVNHKNEIKTDNRVENLEWCDCAYNVNYGTRNERSGENYPLTKRCVVDGVEYVSTREAERQLKTPRGSVANALRKGRTHYKGHSISYN